MKKIVVAQDLGLLSDQIERLEKLGELTKYYDLAESADIWLERCKDADIICTGKFGLKEKIYDLKNVFISLPFVGVGWINVDKIRDNNITIAYAPGCNKDAVSEWIIFMLLSLFRKFPLYLNAKEKTWPAVPKPNQGLTGKKITILGKGNIGFRVGKICTALDMQVNYFERGDNLLESIKEADAVVDCLSLNSSTKGLLNKEFFQAFKQGAFFVTPTSKEIWDIEAIFEALDKNILGGASFDAGGIQVGDIEDSFYKKLVENSKVLVTPHIAYNSDITDRVSGDMMIDNIEAWLNNKAANLLI